MTIDDVRIAPSKLVEPRLIPRQRQNDGMRPPSYRVLNSWVTLFTTGSLLRLLQDRVECRTARQCLIVNHNVNSLSLHQRDSEFRELYEKASYCFIDGAPVVALARASGAPAQRNHRIGVLDWIWPLFALAESKGWTIVHLGSDDPTINNAMTKIRERHPSLNIELIPGYFDPSDIAQNSAIVREIASAKPDVLLVGMGMPRQEHWVNDNLPALPACPIITVGGILGYIGEDRPTAPRWLGRIGLEWLFRLATEPRRLWRRYLVEPAVLAAPILAEAMGRKSDFNSPFWRV